MNRVIKGYQESEAQRNAAERAAAENEQKEASEPNGKSKPAKEMESEDRTITIKAIPALDTAPFCPDTPDLLKVNPNVSTAPLTP
jgi:hypothetical protein